ncbi:MAG TPA: ATP-binding protein [Rhodanobacteraceae bacterium]|nr:ATP-binding protein [Rhodanobacteraceae bacterium]
MKVSISQRLFIATFGALLLLALVGLELVRWTLLDNFAAGTRSLEAQWTQLAPLQHLLEERYRAAGDWRFLPDAPRARREWLRDALAATAGAVPGGSPTLGERIALLDANRQLLAGIRPGHLLRTFASIDTWVRPLRVQGRTVAYLQMAAPARAEDELAVAFLMDQQEHLLWLAALGVLAMGAVSLLLATWLRRPIRQLVAGAQRLEQGHFETRLDARRRDELGVLATAFNRLAARLQALRDEQRRWVADTSHELRTPLAVLQAQTEALADGVRAATPQQVQLMLRQIRGLVRLVDDLHGLATADAGRLQLAMQHCDLWALVDEALQAFAQRFRAARIEVASVSVPPPAWVHGDADRLRQVIHNLLENSLRHTAPGGRLEVAGHAGAGEITLRFDDSAPGVAAQALPRLGERFFRADAARTRPQGGGGSGLGLSVSRQILAAHGGRLTFEASPLGGLRVQVVLPLES